MYRYSKSIVTGAEPELLKRFANEMTYVEYVEWLIAQTEQRLHDMMQNYEIQELYNLVDSRGIALVELMTYRRKCIESWEDDLLETKE